MQRSWLLFLIALAPGFLGCDVISRAEQCERLAAEVSASAKLFPGTELQGDPSPAELRKRAGLYGQLAANLEKTTVKSKAIADERKAVVAQLLALEKHLNGAADAVVDFEQAEKRSEEAEKAEKKRAQEVAAAEAQKPPQGAPPSDGKKSATRPRAVSALVGARSPRAPSSSRQLQYTRAYTQSRRLAEGAGRNVTESLERLSRACR